MTAGVLDGAGRRRRGELALGSPVRGCCRLLAYLALTLAVIPLQAAALALRSPLRERIPIHYHRWCARALGLGIEHYGRPSAERPTLFVANHCSYIDIPVLSTLVPVSFVAKAEVARWPFFGLLAKLQRTVFVDRRRHTTQAQRDEMARRLAAGDNIMLFPEGTSSDGNRLRPFFSALFSAAEERPGGAGGRALAVQPVSVAYTRLDGAPMGYAMRPFIAWYGDMDMMAHLWRLASLGRITAVVQFHPAVTIDEFGSRKGLSAYCERMIGQGLAAALAGRAPANPAA